MPIYEYQCHKCGTFEVTQRITDAPLKKCPTCKGKVERLISATSFVLKGSGWYATDYAHGSGAAAANHKSESDGAAASESSAKAAGSDGASKNGKAEPAPAAPAEKSSAKAAD